MRYRRDMTPAERREWQLYCMRRTRAFPCSDWYDYTFEADDGLHLKLCRARLFTAQWLQNPLTASSIYLWGLQGSGRHFFTGCIANALLDAGADVLVLRYDELLRELREQDHSYAGRWGALKRHDFLAVDLCGSVLLPLSSAKKELLTLLDTCGHGRQRLLLLSDLAPDQLAPGDSLLQRRLSQRLSGFMQLEYGIADYSTPGSRAELFSEYEKSKQAM